MAGKLEDEVVRLEALFQKTESDLDHLTRKLDFELQKTGYSDNQNPVKLIQQISDIKKEYLMVVDETKKIQEAQKEMMDYFQEHLGNLLKINKHLESRTNYNVSEVSDDLKALEYLVGVPIVKEEKTSSSSSSIKDEMPASSQQICSDPPKKTTTMETKEPEKDFASIAFVKSPASKRKNETEFIPLTEEEFNKVSNLVRGRAKLEDVNNCYRVLWQHFKEEKNTEFLTRKDMHNMGLRITGATGEAKLKILRSLKLLTLNSEGSAQIA